MQKPQIIDGHQVQTEGLCTVQSEFTWNRYAYLYERVIATDRMTNRSTCRLTQTSLVCLQKTAGIRQANKDNITFRAAHKTWNAIYCEGSFQNMAAPAVRGTARRGWSPPVTSKPPVWGRDCTLSPVKAKARSGAEAAEPRVSSNVKV